MSTLRTDILALNPQAYYVCDQLPSATVLVNSGTVGAAANANKVSTPLPGAYTLKKDGTETSIFQSGTVASQCWSIPLPAAMVFGATDSFTLYCVLQAFAAPSTANAWVPSIGGAGFGGTQIGIASAGYAIWDISSLSGVSDTTVVPPFIADGLVHDLALVRDVPHNQLQAYLDGRLILFKTDPTAGLAISNNTKNITVGNWGGQNNPFKGLYSDVVIHKGIFSPFDLASLHNGLFAGNPPAVGSSFQSSTLEALALQSAELSALSANVTSILNAVKRTY